MRTIGRKLRNWSRKGVLQRLIIVDRRMLIMLWVHLVEVQLGMKKARDLSCKYRRKIIRLKS